MSRNSQQLEQTPLHIYVVYHMFSVVSAVVLSGSTHRKNKFEGGKGRKGGFYSHDCAIFELAICRGDISPFPSLGASNNSQTLITAT